MNTMHKQTVFGLIIAIIALVLSFVFWTSLLTGAVVFVGDAAHAEDEVFQASTLTLHPSSDEASQWGLRQAWGVSIPTLDIAVPVYLPSRRYWDRQQWNLLEEQMQVGMSQGTVAYPHSAQPGKRGSLFIAGHSSPPNERAKNSAYGKVFARLPEITIGTSIFVEGEEGVAEYIVTDTYVVSPEETDLLTQEYSSRQLKLITCFPIGTTKDRFVVVAHMKKNQ